MNNNDILNIYNKKNEYDNQYDKLVFEFMSKAEVVVTITNGIYQIENSIRGNKISLKDYILNSDLCNTLESRGIKNYSKDELKRYMEMYEKQYPIQVYPYKISFELYELLEKIENLENEKIEYEVNSMKKYLKGFNNINNTSKNNLKELYGSIISELKSKNFDKQANDYFTIIINDIFVFYFSGHKKLNFKS